MRKIFNRKAGFIAGVLAAVMAVSASAGAGVQVVEPEWSKDRIREYLQHGTTVPVIPNDTERGEFAIDTMFIGMMEDALRDEAVEVLRQMLTDPVPAVRADALQGYVRAGYKLDSIPTAQKIATIEGALAAYPDDAELRAWAVRWYQTMITDNPADGALVLPRITARLDDPEGQVRSAAIGALGELGSDSKLQGYADMALDAMIARVADPHPGVRRNIVSWSTIVMNRHNLPRQDELFSVLLPLTADESDMVREEAVLSVRTFTFPGADRAAQIVNALMPLVEDPSEDVRVFIAGSLAEAEVQDPATLQPLVLWALSRMIYDDSERVRYMVTNALSGLSDSATPEALRLLKAMATEPNETAYVKHNAIMMIGVCGQARPHWGHLVLQALDEIQPTLDDVALHESVVFWRDVARDAMAAGKAPAPAPAP